DDGDRLVGGDGLTRPDRYREHGAGHRGGDRAVGPRAVGLAAGPAPDRQDEGRGRGSDADVQALAAGAAGELPDRGDGGLEDLVVGPQAKPPIRQAPGLDDAAASVDSDLVAVVPERSGGDAPALARKGEVPAEAHPTPPPAPGP